MNNSGFLVGGGIATVWGIWMLWDDLSDFGSSKTKTHTGFFHHWMWGILSVVVGLILLIIGIAKTLFTIKNNTNLFDFGEK